MDVIQNTSPMDFLFRNITNSAADVAVQYRYLATETMQRTSIANSSTLVNTAMPLLNGTSESASQPLSASVRFLSAVIRYFQSLLHTNPHIGWSIRECDEFHSLHQDSAAIADIERVPCKPWR